MLEGNDQDILIPCMVLQHFHMYLLPDAVSIMGNTIILHVGDERIQALIMKVLFELFLSFLLLFQFTFSFIKYLQHLFNFNREL